MKEEQWKHGPYLGLILKGYDPLNSSEKSSKTDGFLNFTLTRAIKSSFQGPKSNKDITHLCMVMYFYFLLIIFSVWFVVTCIRPFYYNMITYSKLS